MKFIEISFSQIKKEIEDFLKTEYNKAGILFSTASPYGQILGVIENLQQLSLMYLKGTLNQFDMSNASSTNRRIIRNAAIFAGHNPTRGISATGTLLFKLKTEVDIEKEIPGGKVIFLNKTGMTNKTNGLDYSLDLGAERLQQLVTKDFTFQVNVIQGKWDTKTFTGNGEQLQTFFVNVAGLKDVENFRFEILVNDELWTVKKHIYELLPDEKAVVTKSGFDDGLDIIFGNGGFGAIPELGAIITVRYLKTDGSLGNIFRRTSNDWNFVDDVFDGLGGTLDAGKIFNIEIYTDINFGSDGESTLFTRSLLPMVSNNYVLALPQQYAYEIKKLGVFSHVNAYERNGTVFVAVTPNINLFKNQNNNYFDINIGAFSLDDYETKKIAAYLKTAGNIQLTKNFSIVNPTLSYYVMNIFVIPYSNVTDESLNNQILDVISNYFLNLNRIDRIPKLDLVVALSNITDIHSVDLQFVSKKNEDYHKEAITNLQNQLTPNITSGCVLYVEDMKSSGLKSVNIIKRGTVDVKNKPM